MKRVFIAAALAVGLSAPALADFSDGQRRFQAGDYDGAMAAWMAEANAGDARSQFSLGTMYHLGIGVAADPEVAAEWYQMAARQGYEPARSALQAMGRDVAEAPAQPADRPTATQPRMSEKKVVTNREPRDERERVEFAVKDMLAQVDQSVGERSGRLSYGDVTVTGNDAGYDVKVSDIYLVSGRGSDVEIGTVTGRVNVSDDRLYDIEIDLPAALVVRSAQTDIVTDVTFGSRRAKIRWDRLLQAVIFTDVELSQTVIQARGQADRATIETIAINSDLQETDGLWSGPATFSLRGIKALADAGNSFQLGELTVGAEFTKFDMERYTNIAQELESNRQQGHGQPEFDVTGLLGGVAFNFAVKDLNVVGSRNGDLQLADAHLTLAFENLDQPLSNFILDYGHGGVKSARTGVDDGLSPQEFRLRTTLDRIPLASVAKRGGVMALEYALLGQVTSSGVLFEQLRQELTQAGTILSIENGEFEAPKLSGDLSGALKADASTPLGVVGAFDLRLAGLTDLVKSYMAGDVSGAPSPDVVKALQSFADKGVQQGDSLTYRLEVRRDGQVMLNGENAFTALMEMQQP